MSKAISVFRVYKLIEKVKVKDNSEVYDKVPLLKHLNIDRWVKKPIEETEDEPSMSKTASVGKVSKRSKIKIDSIIKELDIDEELLEDCFPLRKPYRGQVRDAYITLETRIRNKLGLPDEHIGMQLIDEARNLGVFKRPVQAEEQGTYLLFKSTIMSLRNPASHRKLKVEKNEAIKLILFVDYLIKLFENLVIINKVQAIQGGVGGGQT